MLHPNAFRILFLFVPIYLNSCFSESSQNKELIFSDRKVKWEKNYEPDSIKVKLIHNNEVPRNIPFKGEIAEAFTWKDKIGENYLLLSSLTKSKADQFGQSGSKYIFAYNYVKKGVNYNLLWKMNDLIEDCPTNLICDFFQGATTVTDLDLDGIAEIKLQYEQGCISDVRPTSMKLLFYEDGKKRALRGVRWVDEIAMGFGNRKEYPYAIDEMVSKEKFKSYVDFGKYESEADFKNDPSEFLNFVRQEWRKYVVLK